MTKNNKDNTRPYGPTGGDMSGHMLRDEGQQVRRGIIGAVPQSKPLDANQQAMVDEAAAKIREASEAASDHPCARCGCQPQTHPAEECEAPSPPPQTPDERRGSGYTQLS